MASAEKIGINKQNGALYDVRLITDFRDMINQSARLFPEEPAFMMRKSVKDDFTSINYRELREEIRAWGTALYSMGLSGQKVAVMGANSYRWCLTYLAVTSGVGVIVPIDKELMFDDINNILTVSESKVLVADAKAIKKIKDRRGELPGDLRIISMDPVPEGEDYISFDELFAKGVQMKEENANAYRYYMTEKIDPDAMSVLIFTSGTSGLAKGVMLSQRNICYVVMSNTAVAYTSPGDRMLSVLPIHHTFECSLGFLLPLYNGCCIFHNDSLLHLATNMQDFKPTIIFTVPLLVEKFHDKIEKAAAGQKHGSTKLRMGRKISVATSKFGISISDKIFAEVIKNFGGCLRLFIVGAAAIDPKVVEDFKAYGIGTYLGYGLTECAPLVACNHDGFQTTDTVGKPIPGVQIKVVNPGDDGVGEVMIKGDNVMLGYYKNPELNEEIFEDGWLHTGDLGYFTEEGYLKLTGRAKNVILTKNGENVYPEEIEDLLMKNPYIAEAMVVGQTGEDGMDTVVTAKIYPDREAIEEELEKAGKPSTAEAVSEYIAGVVKEINKLLPKYKNIGAFDIRENEFIKTTTAKIKRYANMDDGAKTEGLDVKEDVAESTETAAEATNEAAEDVVEAASEPAEETDEL